MSAESEALAVLRALMTNPHIDLGDQIYVVREHEGQGWDGPAVQAWSDAVTAAEDLLRRADNASAGKE